MSKSFAARVRFLPAEEGGFTRPPGDGVRPHLKVGDVFTTCIVRASGPIDRFELGHEHEVLIEVVFWDDYQQHFHEGMEIELYDGARLVAVGRFLEPLPPRTSPGD